MADAKARKAAMKKATSQVRSGSGFTKRAAITGRFVSAKSTTAKPKKR
jgi:hypothetical protein